MIQLDIVKAYDHVSRFFVSQLISHMSFGIRMSRLTFMLGPSAVPRVMLNGEGMKSIPLKTSIQQGCPLSPSLLFTIATHPIIVKMHELTVCVGDGRQLKADDKRQIRGLMREISKKWNKRHREAQNGRNYVRKMYSMNINIK